MATGTSFRISEAAKRRLAARAAREGMGPTERIDALSAESSLHPRLITIALDYAAAHPDEIRRRIARNRELAESGRQIPSNAEEARYRA